MTFAETKYKVEEKLKEGCFTVQELCKMLDVTDDFEVIRAIGRLEFERKVRGDSYKQVFREDGGAILLARYTHA